jgi:hypothetical protein
MKSKEDGIKIMVFVLCTADLSIDGKSCVVK